jgi:hypothetical protein
MSLPSVVAQYPVLQAIPISIVAIKVPSLIVLTLFALNPLMVSSSLNSCWNKQAWHLEDISVFLVVQT